MPKINFIEEMMPLCPVLEDAAFNLRWPEMGDVLWFFYSWSIGLTGCVRSPLLQKLGVNLNEYAKLVDIGHPEARMAYKDVRETMIFFKERAQKKGENGIDVSGYDGWLQN